MTKKQKHLKQASKEIDPSSAFTLASLLITISTIFISLLASGVANVAPVLFGAIGYLAVVSAALLVDWVLDVKLKLTLSQRLKFLNTGYLLFAATLTAVAFGVLFTTNAAVLKELKLAITDATLIKTFIVFGTASFSLFFKVLTKEDNGFWGGALLVTSVVSFIWILHGYFRISMPSVYIELNCDFSTHSLSFLGFGS